MNMTPPILPAGGEELETFRERARESPFLIRRHLRNEMTMSERLLWDVLRNRSFYGLKFRRQHGIGPFIVDFYCHVLKLIIEVDGGIHKDDQIFAYDQERSLQLEKIGYRIFRCKNEEVEGDLENMLCRLREFIRRFPPRLRGG